MSRIASSFQQSAPHPQRSSQFGEDDGWGQPIDPYETLPDGGIPMSTALDSAPISSGDLDADVMGDIDADETRWKPRRQLSPEQFARLRLAMAFARS